MINSMCNFYTSTYFCITSNYTNQVCLSGVETLLYNVHEHFYVHLLHFYVLTNTSNYTNQRWSSGFETLLCRVNDHFYVHLKHFYVLVNVSNDTIQICLSGFETLLWM